MLDLSEPMRIPFSPPRMDFHEGKRGIKYQAEVTTVKPSRSSGAV